MANQNNSQGKPCLPCYLKIQESNDPDDGLVGVKILELTPDNLLKPAENPDRYSIKQLPATFAEGTAIVGSSTYLNKYSQLIGIVKSMSGGPNFVDTRDNKIEIHNGKQSGNTVYAYTYAGGTGELLEFHVKTKFSQSIEAGKSSSINPDNKTIESEVVQCIPTEEDPCKPDAYIDPNKPSILKFQRDATRMAKFGQNIVPNTTRCRQINNKVNQTPTYSSITDAKQQISSNPSLTEEEVKAYNKQISDEWEEYKKSLKEFEDKIKSGNTDDIKLPIPPNEVSTFTIKRKVIVYLNPIDYASDNSTAYWQNRWREGYRALKKNSEITLITSSRSSEKPYGDYPYDYPGSTRSLVRAEMEVEVQIPGVRVVADPLFTTLGSLVSNDIIESVNSQVKAKAKFVGNPNMKSSQIIEIKNVGKKYSTEWYAKEVDHSFDSSGYFTEVDFEKKTRNSIVNRISTEINTQEVYQKAHDVATESYKTGAWKIPSKIKSEVEKYKNSSWNKGEKEDPQRSGRQILVRQDSENPYKYQIFDSDKDFQVDREVKK